MPEIKGRVSTLLSVMLTANSQQAPTEIQFLSVPAMSEKEWKSAPQSYPLPRSWKLGQFAGKNLKAKHQSPTHLRIHHPPCLSRPWKVPLPPSSLKFFKIFAPFSSHQDTQSTLFRLNKIEANQGQILQKISVSVLP